MTVFIAICVGFSMIGIGDEASTGRTIARVMLSITLIVVLLLAWLIELGRL